MEIPNFKSRQFAVYGMWRTHQLEFNRDGRMTRLVITWSREAYRDERGALNKCMGGALFDPHLISAEGENRQFFFFTKEAEVEDVLKELRKIGDVEFTFCNSQIVE